MRTSGSFTIYELAVFLAQNQPNTSYFLSPFYFLLTYVQALPSGRLPSGFPVTMIYWNRGEIHLETKSYFKSETTFLNLYICGSSWTVLGLCTLSCQYFLLQFVVFCFLTLQVAVGSFYLHYGFCRKLNNDNFNYL